MPIMPLFDIEVDSWTPTGMIAWRQVKDALIPIFANEQYSTRELAALIGAVTQYVREEESFRRAQRRRQVVADPAADAVVDVREE